MSEYSYNTLASFLKNWQSNTKYFDMLRKMAQLSKLFSISETPYLDYRLAENLFCRYYTAQNDARACMAYDARLSTLGIGIKTFILKGDASFSQEKIAEFNKLKKQLDPLCGIELAKQIGLFRNERMQTANDVYGVTETQYHIVGRSKGLLRVFNTPYEKVDIEHIHLIKDDDTSCSFDDEKNEYTFNKSKSVLLKRFYVPLTYKDVCVEMLKNPLELFERLFDNEENTSITPKIIGGTDYVILPLYSIRSKQRDVAQGSGLNQFNAKGRPRHRYEVYIPIPATIHKAYPNFFPGRDEPFTLYLPDGKKLSAKVCQDGGKALMSNPNKDLGEWLIGKVLKKKEGELVTRADLDRLGFDSVCVENLHSIDDVGLKEYRISLSDTTKRYEDFRMEIE
ncbi:MAG TPA: restriction endonuclease [Prevotellaceae bacterium]|jgi:hypothetical protein|nr:restriction endonuclease [Prevotellaceae bacterium]